ncbi:BTB/POZ domain-containing protein At3g22104 [Impatiens glandulifera]|uniref:BTB/POZ domain-containing protein At3g22104 n=1 Tax=Impatiens glandulifera TaxID=253017 RepID=UPI001FB19488|nr:BTB/POZ domain-containing protein At3g22104 [Impatiens glandulifera]
MDDLSCDLEVDVNGEETFILDKKIIAAYSARISRLFGKSIGSAQKHLKIIFHDFPGGAKSFELAARFCYNHGRIHINPFNATVLHSTAHFMEMDSLTEQTHKSLEGIAYWSWSQLVLALKQCQDFLPFAVSSGMLEKILDSIIGRIVLANETASLSPSTSSPDSIGIIRHSCDTKSTESLRNSSIRSNWWYEDLASLNPDLIEMVVKTMMAKRRINHANISRFLFYFQKSKPCRKVTEAVIDMLHGLERNLISCKSLFGILRVISSMNVSKNCKNKLESMIGSVMDQSTLDNLLVPSPPGTNYLYDVNLVLRFMKAFQADDIGSLHRLKKVGSLIDLYIAEVAPDPFLKPSKFLALVKALPDSARDSFDEVYRSIDMYIEVHSGISEEDKANICLGMNYEKLSSEAWKHLALNKRFPSKSSVQALVSQQSNLKILLKTRPLMDSQANTKEKKDENHKQIVVFAEKLDVSEENEKLRAHLEGMQWRVMELEKVCKKMQSQMSKVAKSSGQSRTSSSSSSRSIPRLCS